MKVILEENDIEKIIETVIDRISAQKPAAAKWLSRKEAMETLKIKSLSTLQKLRNTGAIRYTAPKKRIILYDADSLLEYLERHAHNTF